jgi:hypothetical protein
VSQAKSFWDVSGLTPDVNGTSKTYVIGCAAEGHPGINCEVTVNRANTVEAIGTTYDVLTVSNFLNDLVGG